MIITVDHRDRDLIPIYKKLFKHKDIQVDMATLPIGDVLCENIIIERKRADDLVGSVKDGRIFNQALNMATLSATLPDLQNDMLPFLIVVGTLEEWMPAWNKYSQYTTSADNDLVYGAFASLATRYGITCMWIPDDISFCKLSYKIFEKHLEGKTAVPSRITMMVRTRDKRVDIIKLLFSIPEKPARAVLAKGKTLRGVFELRESELLDIEGIGSITAKKIVAMAQLEEPFKRI